MPIVKRAIEPSAISRGPIGSDVKNELECVSNNTLSLIIKQLSSLSKQSEDLFGELYVETCTLANRTTNLSRRIDGLKQKICQLNPIVEEVLLQEINQRKPFKSLMCRDQQIMLKSTRPYSINEVYRLCETPPALNKLDVFREDGIDSLKFYTNPEYFAELWFAEMKAAQHQQKKQKHKHSQMSTNQKPKSVRTPKNKLDDFKELKHGPEFVDRPDRQLQQQNLPQQQQQHVNNNHTTTKKSQDTNHKQHNKPAIVHPNLKDLNYDEFDNGQYNRYGGEDVSRGIKEDHGVINHFDLMQHEKQRMADCRSNSVSQISTGRPSAPPPAPPTSATLKKHSSVSHQAINNNDINNYNVVQQYQQMQQQNFVASSMPSQQQDYQIEDHQQQQQQINYDPSSSSNTPSFKRPELPPPPSPPMQDQSFDCPTKLPSPGAMPSPPAFVTSDHQDNQHHSTLPPPPPLPDSLLAKMLPYGIANNNSNNKDISTNGVENRLDAGCDDNSIQHLKVANSHLFQPDEESINSSSTTTTDTNTDAVAVVIGGGGGGDGGDVKRMSSNVGDKGPLVRDTRSDLLSAIREGIQLRKVEENRLKSEQKNTKKGGSLDVQSIMEAAFEMRRKVMENDDEEDEDDEENNWSD